MTESKVRVERPAVVLHTRPALELDEEQFFEFCQLNNHWRIERSAEGDLEVMVPTGFETSDRNSEINIQLRLWAKQDGSGIASDSSGGFVLPTVRCVRRTLRGYGASGRRISQRNRSRGSSPCVPTS